MSGGAILVAPVLVMGAAAIAAAAVVIGAAVAVALVVRAAQAGTVATGRAVEQLGEAMAQTADAQDDLAVRTRLWELAAGAVVQTNSEICLLSGRARKAGVRPQLPPPLDLTGLGLADTRGLVAQAQEALVRARAVIEKAEAEREQQTILAEMAVPADARPSAAEALAHYRLVLARRRTASPQQPPVVVSSTVDSQRVGAEVDEILARLDVDATADEHAEAILAAGRVAKQSDPGMASTHLGRLTRIIDDQINPKVARRKDAAGYLSALLHPVVAAAIAETSPRPPFLRSIAKLQAVVQGDADLTDADRRDALDSLAWAEQAVERRQLLRALNETLTTLGYRVTTGLQTRHTEVLSIASDRWHGGHSADVWIDDEGGVQFRMVELHKGATGEATHCVQLNQAISAAGEELALRGFAARVRVPEKPMKATRRWTGDQAVQHPFTEDTETKPKAKELDVKDEK
jgi:hypothetical protein